MSKRLVDAVLLVLGLCVAVRLAVWLVQPVLLPVAVVVGVGGLLVVLFHRHWA